MQRLKSNFLAKGTSGEVVKSSVKKKKEESGKSEDDLF